MKAITKKIVSVMMAATFLGAAPVVLPESFKPAAITASAWPLYDTVCMHYTIPVYGYNYGWYPHTGTTYYADRDCIKFIQAYYNAMCGNDRRDRYGNLWQKIAVDGIYGPATTEAVRKMQQVYNDNPEINGWLAEDGIFGPATFRSLMPEYCPV